MREVTDHRIEAEAPGRDELVIRVIDEPGPGGAHHAYDIEGQDGVAWAGIRFQRGAIQENGINGVTNEALLAIVIDRLRDFQKGPFPCPHNAQALSLAVMSLNQLKDRTRERLARGVEGQEKA